MLKTMELPVPRMLVPDFIGGQTDTTKLMEETILKMCFMNQQYNSDRFLCASAILFIFDGSDC